MAAKKKPSLVKVGDHLIDILDVACISKTRTGLYVVRLKSQPNMEFPIWVRKNQITALLEHFDIQVSDEVDDKDD